MQITLTGVLYVARHTSVRNPRYDGRQTPQILLITASARTAGAMMSSLSARAPIPGVQGLHAALEVASPPENLSDKGSVSMKVI